MQQKCGMLINNVNNVKRWFYEKKEKIKIKKTLSVNSCSIIVFIGFFILSTYKKSI